MIRFSYKLLGAGSAAAHIEDATGSLDMFISYLQPASLDLLSDSVYRLLQANATSYPVKVEFVWLDEPGEYRWSLEKTADQLHIEIYHMAETFSRLSNDHGTLAFSTDCSPLKFAIQVHTTMRELLEAHSLAEYQEQWRGPFPLDSYQALGAEISAAKKRLKAGRQ